MPFGVPGLKKPFVAALVLIAASVAIVSCGGNNSASGLRFRAFVSNPLFATVGAGTPVINIVDAQQDLLSPSTIGLVGTVTQPGLMVVSADLSRTLVFSPVGNVLALIDNTTESLATATGSTSALPTITLPGLTESIVLAKDNATAYAAVPTAPVTGQPAGVVVAMNFVTGAITAMIPVPAAHFIVASPDGNHILVFSDNSDNVTVIATALIGTNTDPRQPVGGIGGFHRPVWGTFTNNATAYIFNCGPECGGTTAGITKFTIGASGPGATTPVSAATYGVLNGNTLYVAGTPPRTPCGAGTAATACGTLSVVDVSSMKVTAGPVIITDGYHNRMQMGANGQLFIGAHGCTNVNISGGEVRGCLSIFNTSNSKVVIPPDLGDATGIEPIAGRTVVYVCQGGVFRIYDTTTDQLLVQPNGMIDIVGQSFDVKLVDPPVQQF
jgi:hypothetical protein